jgi:peptidylprolyl isomerase
MRALSWRGALLAVAVGFAAGCTGDADGEKKVTQNGIRYVDLAEGSGEPAKFGDGMVFTYTGFLTDGRRFEKRDKDNPTVIRVGFNQVVPGLDEGLEKIKTGGKRKIWIPSRMAYGVTGSAPKVPPNADLIFEVEVLRIATPDQIKAKAEEDDKKRIEEAKSAAARRAEEDKLATGTDIPTADRKEVETPSGLKYTDTKIGDGRQALPGNKVSVLYVGRLTDGTRFDSNQNAGHPFMFTLGNGEVINGWDEGIAGMKAGGKRHLVIPSRLAYGANPDPKSKIPPHATLVFDVELLKVR